jgi:peptidoglycan-associated lipoprotein
MRSTTFIACAVALACALTAAGCARKQKAKTAPEAAPPQATAAWEPAAAASAPEAAPAVASAEADPLDGDLDSVNQYLRRQGLLSDAFFEYDRAELTAEARDKLARNSKFLSQHPDFHLTVEGHCDERGTPEYNLALGERRAAAARDYMESLGVDHDRLRTVSYGEERPVCQQSEESCWSQNRRAHPMVTGRSHG